MKKKRQQKFKNKFKRGGKKTWQKKLYWWGLMIMHL